jgi:hypothetical protein
VTKNPGNKNDFILSRRRIFAPRGAEQHQHAEHEQHDAPDEVDVDAERNGVAPDLATPKTASSAPMSVNMRPIGQRISSPINLVFDCSDFSPENKVQDDADNEQHRADDGRALPERLVVVHDFRRERIDEAFQIGVGLGAAGRQRNHQRQREAHDERERRRARSSAPFRWGKTWTT